MDGRELPHSIARKLPHRLLPVAVLAWLGVAASHQGKGFGTILLAQSLRDCYEASRIFPFVAVILDALDDRSKAFYQRFDFTELPGHPNRLFLPMSQLMTLMTSSK